MLKKQGQKKPLPNSVDICGICQNVCDYCECADKKMSDYQLQVASQIKNWKHWKHWKISGVILFAVILWLAGIYAVFLSSPAAFPSGMIVKIRKGTTISQVADGLYQHHLIRSPRLFKLLARFTDEGKIIAGEYKFAGRQNVIDIATRLTGGVFGIETAKILIEEGHSVKEVAILLERNLPAFDKELFLTSANDKEGQLFPDTYFIKPMDDETDIVNMMIDNFNLQIKPLEGQISKSGHSLNEILTMASIIELEARTPESRRMVSGILWNRIRKKMKLQVDAVFPFIMNKYSLKLTVSDLQYDSPYNTYKYLGLPPGPVANPGIEAIKAALEPTKSNYLYYLSGNDGTMHYATTYKAHMQNRAKYLAGR